VTVNCLCLLYCVTFMSSIVVELVPNRQRVCHVCDITRWLSVCHMSLLKLTIVYSFKVASEERGKPNKYNLFLVYIYI